MVWWLGIDKVKDTIRHINEELEEVFINKTNGPIFLIDKEDLSYSVKEETKDKK